MRIWLRRSLIVALVLGIAVVLYIGLFTGDRVVAREVGAKGIGSVTLLSATHTIDRIYPSMMGPSSEQEKIDVVSKPAHELIWLTGIKSELVGVDGMTQVSRECFCHSNLTVTPGREWAQIADR